MTAAISRGSRLPGFDRPWGAEVPRANACREPRSLARHEAHIRAVSEALSGLPSGLPLCNYVNNAYGANPADVREALHLLHRHAEPSRAEARAEDPPELHPLDSEWYFDDASAARLATLGGNRSVACLGTPTVACSIASNRDDGTNVCLFDYSAGLVERLKHVTPKPRFVLHDLAQPLPGYHFPWERYEIVILDPPWHYCHLASWLSLATKLVRAGGQVVFPLFGDLAKLRARAERAGILALAAHAGTVTVEPGAVRYCTPRFEYEAFASVGSPPPPYWRRADLIHVTVQRSVESPVHPPAATNWSTYFVRGQTVKLAAAAVRKGRPVSFLAGLANLTLPSVSRSDPRRARIGIWTSRNRVAEVGDPDLVRGWLHDLSTDHTPVVSADERVYFERLVSLLAV